MNEIYIEKNVSAVKSLNNLLENDNILFIGNDLVKNDDINSQIDELRQQKEELMKILKNY